MGGSESLVKNYTKQYGVEALYKFIMLQKKIDWLRGNCRKQIILKLDDQIRYILYEMDQLINQKKQSAIQQYKITKSDILEHEPNKVKNYEQKHKKSLQNIYGKNNLLDRLNLMKINFHIQVLITKKQVKKAVQQKIASIQTHLLYQEQTSFIPKQVVGKLNEDEKFKSKLYQHFPLVDEKFQQFKKQIISQFDFKDVFWPHYDRKLRQTQLQVDRIYSQVQKNASNMRNDLLGIWNLFTFQ